MLFYYGKMNYTCATGLKVMHQSHTFAVPELASCLLATVFNPSSPALVCIFTKFRGSAVPVNRHEVDGIFVGSVCTQNDWSEKTEVQLSLK